MSDVPLDPVTRILIAGELARLYKSEKPDRERERLEKLWFSRRYQNYCEQVAGMKPGDAEGEAAEAVGLSVDALRKLRSRAKPTDISTLVKKVSTTIID